MIVIIGGTKGGTGKSLVSGIAYDYFLSLNNNPILVETDTSNPDVYKAYTAVTDDNKVIPKKYNNNDIEALKVNINRDKGWEDLINIFDKANQDNHNVLVNTAAENIETIQRNGVSLNLFDGDIITLWVINNKLDSVILLREYISVVKRKICIVKNLFFCPENEFTIYDESNVAKENNFPFICFPQIPDGAQYAFYNNRTAIHELDDVLTLGSRLIARAQIKEAVKIAARVK